MTDTVSKEKRSEIMSKIRGKDTKIEILVRKWLFHNGFRYRKNDKKIVGTPDIVLPKYKTVIFVNGCFWHGHKNCKLFKIPKTHTDYWQDKLNANIARDKKNIKLLKSEGWKVIVIWECELMTKPEELLENLIDEIRNNDHSL